MTDAEIRMSYRDARNKEEQIQILSDLTARSANDIRAVLGLRPAARSNGKLDRDEALKLYRQGMVDQKIADALGVSKTTVCKWRTKNGLAVVKKGLMEDERALELYQQGLVDREIALKLQVSNSKVQVWRKKHGLDPNGWNRPKKGLSL